MISDLPPWLLEQVAADERLASGWPTDQRVEGGINRVLPGLDEVYIAIDRDRLLVECAVKRQLVHEILGELKDGCDERDQPQMELWRLRMLALPYADRPGYLPEWAPADRINEGPKS